MNHTKFYAVKLEGKKFLPWAIMYRYGALLKCQLNCKSAVVTKYIIYFSVENETVTLPQACLFVTCDDPNKNLLSS
jgi:hypothetical protein